MKPFIYIICIQTIYLMNDNNEEVYYRTNTKVCSAQGVLWCFFIWCSV